MIINRVWAMPNKHTFKIKPIYELLEKYLLMGVNSWVDPFCGLHSLCKWTLRNDLNPDIDAFSHQKAISFLKPFPTTTMDGVLFDPPYSPRQIKDCYEGIGLEFTKKDAQNQWTEEKVEIARIIKPGGICISFGWNSNGIGKKRGFKIIEVLLVAHGSAHNDTICIVERKL